MIATDATLYMRFEGYEYFLQGGGNDVTLIQRNQHTRLVEQRRNCRSVEEAKQCADLWAEILLLQEMAQ